ncbi:hypothetical protein BTO32_10445 [Marinobacter lutaoensis]|uniref:HTH lysR-type domain-containing protein n=1 Tax=Marinobacter lutaoensis TaxID=135739 RepID=A0A1V2DR36_9GAMM|nr:hypothetical protein BTO32_10445 [Marinobacter lutaoensis]
MHTVPSNVTAHIRTLEEALGATLIDRQGLRCGRSPRLSGALWQAGAWEVSGRVPGTGRPGCARSAGCRTLGPACPVPQSGLHGRRSRDRPLPGQSPFRG